MLADRAGIVGRIDQLDYSLPYLVVEVRGVVLATRDHPDQPFASVSRLRLDLAPSALSGALAVDSLEIDDARLSLGKLPDGNLNLPRAEEPAAPPPPSPAEPQQLTINRLAICRLAFEYREGIGDISRSSRRQSRRGT